MCKRLFLALVLLTVYAGLTPAWAEKADRNKPMNIESDALRYDDVRQLSIFSGRVSLTKGTITIRGEQIEVRQDAEGYQYGTVTGSPQTPAFFRQKRDGIDEFIEGEGELIEYDGKADTVRFVRNAKLRRYRGSTLADEISGAKIVYQNLSDMFSVDGSSPKGGPGVGSTGVAGGRVHAMLTPKPDLSPNSPGQNELLLRPSATLPQPEASK